MAITPLMVKDLREKTAAGMADCKKALEASDGDMQGAIEYLRKKGAASAAKRADKEAKEGMAIAKTTPDGKTAVILAINCETDFVAKNAEFEKFANAVADTLLVADKCATIEDVWNLKTNDGAVLRDLFNDTLSKFNEKIELRRFEQFKGAGYIAPYIHLGSKLAVLVLTDGENLPDEAKALVKNIAMQIAAMSPSFVCRAEVDEATLAKEKEIAMAQILEEGKKPEFAERILIGKIEKYYNEACLIEQIYVKDQKRKVSDVIDEISKIAGKEVKILAFHRFLLG